MNKVVRTVFSILLGAIFAVLFVGGILLSKGLAGSFIYSGF